jgi:hypothetical protein
MVSGLCYSVVEMEMEQEGSLVSETCEEEKAKSINPQK